MKINDNKALAHIGSMAANFDNQGNIWLSHSDINGLYKYNVHNKTSELIYVFEDVPVRTPDLHNNLYIRDSKVYMFPLMDKKIRVYEIEEKKEYSIDLPFENNDSCRNFIYNNICWIFSKKLYKFDLITEQFEDDSVCRSINGLLNEFDISTWDMFMSSGKLFLINRDNHFFYDYSIENNCLTKISTKSLAYELLNVFWFKNKYWMTCFDTHNVVSYDANRDLFVEYKGDNLEFEKSRGHIAYSNLVEIDSNLVLLNYYSAFICKIDENNHSIEKLVETQAQRTISNYGPVYIKVIRNEDALYFIPKRGDCLLKYENGQFETISLFCDVENISYFCDVYKEWWKQEIIGETEKYKLAHYLKYIVNQDDV